MNDELEMHVRMAEAMIGVLMGAVAALTDQATMDRIVNEAVGAASKVRERLTQPQ